jgi:YbgC/YbaW family acyl-CoA thioester hydrolase
MHRFEREQLVARPVNAFAARRTVRFQDVDAAGIIFFARVLEYFHDAYVSLLDAGGSPLHLVLRERRWAAPLRHAEADYLKPLVFGDIIEVAIVRAHVEPTEVAFGYRIEKADGEVAAVGQTVHTFVHPASFRRAEIPPDLRLVFEKIGVT